MKRLLRLFKRLQSCLLASCRVLASYEMLAVWTTLCWAHRFACEEHETLLAYSAALNPTDLRHLALDDVKAIEALGCVRVFLEKHRKSAAVPFRDWGDTLKLALAFGRCSALMQGVYSTELEAANEEIKERYLKN